VRLEPTKPITVSGHVVVDPVAARSFRPEMFRFGATAANPMDQMMMVGPSAPPAAVKSDLTFEFKSYPGSMVVRSMVGTSGWMIKSIFLNGADVTDGVTFRNEDVSGLEIELSNRVPDISGLVTNSKGEVVKEYTAIAFPADSTKWNAPGPGRNAIARPTGDDGRFSFRTLRPGEYYLVAVDHIQNGQWMDPEYLESVVRNGTRISVSEGDTKTVDLKLTQGQ
jgi:hypothetical protein